MSGQSALSVTEALLIHGTPDDQARAIAARHRAKIEEWLKRDLGIVRMRETGSWHHGTALNVNSDVDYFVSMAGSKPPTSSVALEQVRASLSRGLGGCSVRIDRPAVRIQYHDNSPAVEITPAYFRQTDDYDIPDPDGAGWIPSNPALHLDYVNKVQQMTDGKAKGLVRLVKIWRTLNAVPLSSFYLEMRTAQYAAQGGVIAYDRDLRGVFKSLHDGDLVAMNDPTKYGRRINTGARSLVDILQAKNAVAEAAKLSGLAREATESGDDLEAARLILMLFDVKR